MDAWQDHVRARDRADRAVRALGGSVYAASKINGTRIKKGSEPGNRLKANTVTGKQVNESTLGTVPNAAKVGGAGLSTFTIGRSTANTSSGGISSSCDPGSSSFVDCGTVTLQTPRSGRVLIIADAAFDGASSGSGYRGDCKLTVDGTRIGSQVSGGSSDGFGVGFNANQQGGIGLNAVTDPLDSGLHNLALLCNQAGGSVEFPETFVSAAMLGTG